MTSRSTRRDRLEIALRQQLNEREYRLLMLRLRAAQRAFETLEAVAPAVLRSILPKKPQRNVKHVPADIQALFDDLLGRVQHETRPQAQVLTKAERRRTFRIVRSVR